MVASEEGPIDPNRGQGREDDEGQLAPGDEGRGEEEEEEEEGEESQQHLVAEAPVDNPPRREPRREAQGDDNALVIDLQNDQDHLLVQAQERHRDDHFLSAPNSLYALFQRAQVHGTGPPLPQRLPQVQHQQQLPREPGMEGNRLALRRILRQAIEIVQQNER